MERNTIKRLRSASASIVFLLAGAGFFPASSESAEQEIEQVIEQMWEALGKQDAASFRGLTDPDWRLYTAMGNKLNADRLFEIHQANIQGFQLKVRNARVRVRGEMAWATYDAVMSGLFQGDPWGGEFVMTSIFENRDSRWLCLHTHESKRPEQ